MRGKAEEPPPPIEVYDSTTVSRAGGPPAQRTSERPTVEKPQPKTVSEPAPSGLTSAASEASGARREGGAERARRPARAQRAPKGTERAPTNTEVLSSQDDGTGTKEKAEREPPDWAHFAPLPERVPTRRIRVAGAVARVLGHEWTLAILAGVALSLVLNWRALADPRHALPQDLADPSMAAYLIGWVGHALGHDATNLWHVNAFFPAPLGLAYGDPLLGYAPLGLIGTGPEAAVLRYNLILLAGHALAFVGPYALARQLGLARFGAILVGTAVAVAPWRLGGAGHVHVLSGGAAVLALAMLARAHGVRWLREPTTERGTSEAEATPHKHSEPTTERGTSEAEATPREHGRDGDEQPRQWRPEWALPGWLLAAWQLSIGFSVGLIGAYLIAGGFLIGLVRWAVRRRGRPNRWLVLADAVGLLFFAGAAVFVARAQLRVLDLYPDASPVAAQSPPLRGLLTAPAGSLVWGGAHATSRDRLPVPGEMALLPGYALYALAAAGVGFSVWALWVRLALLAGAVAGALLVLGTHGPGGGKAGYLWVAGHLPGFETQRAPAHLILWMTLLLGLLAAGGLCALVARVREMAQREGAPGPTAEALAALLLPVALVLVEGLGVPAYRPVPPAPAAMAAPAPYLVLPSEADGDGDVMLWSTGRYADLVNGAGPLVPDELAATRERVRTFPDAESVDYLRKLGVRTVILLPERAKGTPWERAAEAPVEGLPGVTREAAADAVIFRLG